MEKIDILSLKKDILAAHLSDICRESYRAGQIFNWLHAKHVSLFEEMSSIPRSLIRALNEKYRICDMDVIKTLISKEDETTKYLFKAESSTIIESVFMKYSFGSSVCISSQAGCRMGCAFCASTKNGLERNLSAGEMLRQVYAISSDKGEKISHVVVMGTGEPLDNYDALIDFLSIINDSGGVNMSHRHITVSTCGILERIIDLMALRLQITLAISLHAPNDEIRRKLMPVARSYPIDDVLEVGSAYARETGRRVTYEYAMISGVNDSAACARELAVRLKSVSLAHVNLIPVNEVKESGYKKSDGDTVLKFFNILKEKGVSVTVRRELGCDISAACGQLRNAAKR